MLYLDDKIDTLSNNDIEKCFFSISSQRVALIKSFVFTIDKEQSLKSYQLLQKGLFQEYGIIKPPLFGFYEYGKPFLADYPDIHFNISHCKRAVVCYLSNHPVGIDVEEITPFDSDVAHLVLNQQEYERVLNAEEPCVEFTILWTMKESLIKLTGEGIDDNLLRDLLRDSSKYSFQTTVNKEKGYVITTCERRI